MNALLKKKNTNENQENPVSNDKDYMVRAIAADGAIRAFAITSKHLTEEARKRHGSSPTITAALGRLMAGGAMMGIMMKGDQDLLTLKIHSEGPVRGLTVTADAHGNVKGYPVVPVVNLPANEKGKFDVGGAVAPGQLQVIKDLGLKEPYVGTTQLVNGEIAEDLTYYFAVSEQTPSAVGLGVLMSKENTVRQAGGFIIQLMPHAADEIIDLLEKKIHELLPVTTLLDQGHTPETLLELILGDLDLEITDRTDAAFTCNCSKERVSRVLYSIGKEELTSMIAENEPVEVKCHFCNEAYTFSVEELKRMITEPSA